MATFSVKNDVDAFETGGPNGLLRVEAFKPLTTEDSAELAALRSAGEHVLNETAAAPKAAAKSEKGDES